MKFEALFELGVDEMSWDDTVSMTVCVIVINAHTHYNLYNNIYIPS